MTATLERNDLADTIELGPLRPRARLLDPVRRLVHPIVSHPAFVAVFTIGVAVRVLAIAAYRPALLFYGDSYTYLQMSHTLQPDPVRPLVYPVFIRALTWAPFGRNLAFLIIVQHLMGLGIGLLVYALARRFGLPKWAAAIAAAPILLDAYQVNIEHYVMAEVLFQAFLLCAFAFLVWDERPSGPFCAFAGGLLGLAALSRTVGLALIPFALLFLFLKKMGVGRIVAFVAAAAVIMGGFSLVFGRANASAEGNFLYGRAMTFADCSKFDVPPNMLALCDSVPVAERPNTNFYVWGKNTAAQVVSPPKGITTDRMLRNFALDAMFGQPVDYAHTVARDVVHYFRPGHISGRLDEPGAQWRFPRHLDHTQFWIETVRAEDDSAPMIAAGPAALLRGYQGLMFPDGPIFAVLFVLALAGAWILRGRPSGPPASIAITFATVLLVVPPMTAMFDYRYFLPAMPFLSLAGAFGLHAIWERAPRAVARIALLGIPALFVLGVSLAFALTTKPGPTVAAACSSVAKVGYGTKAARAGGAAQHRTESAYIQEMYRAAADRESAVIGVGGDYRRLWDLLMDASGAAGNEYALERDCSHRHCGSRTQSPAKKLAAGKQIAVLALRRVRQFCEVHFPAPSAHRAKPRKGPRAPPLAAQAILPSRPRFT